MLYEVLLVRRQIMLTQSIKTMTLFVLLLVPQTGSFIIYLQESNLGWLRDKLDNVDFNNMIFPLNSVIIQHLDRLSM